MPGPFLGFGGSEGGLTVSHSANGRRVAAGTPIRSQIRVTVGGPGADIVGKHSRAIQAAIDYVHGVGGGVVELAEGEFTIVDAVYLRNNVVLRGQGQHTALVKCDAKRTNLLVDADVHETSVTVEDPTGLEVGMGVSIGDTVNAIRSLVSVRTIVWISGNELGFNHALETTQMVCDGAFAQVTFPVIYGLEVENVTVEDLTVDGNAASNPMIDSWSDGGIYLLRVRGGRLLNCGVHHVNADGISLNTSDDIVIEGCEVHDNARLGIHIGSGSQRTVVRGCRIFSNGLMGPGRSGLHLCFSAQHGVYDANEIHHNRGAGISIGHKDSDNLFVANVLCSNGHGVYYRSDTYRTYDNTFRDCVIEDNGDEREGYGFYLSGDAHHTTLETCTIRDTRPPGQKTQRVGLFLGPGLQDTAIVDCAVTGNRDEDVHGQPD